MRFEFAVEQWGIKDRAAEFAGREISLHATELKEEPGSVAGSRPVVG